MHTRCRNFTLALPPWSSPILCCLLVEDWSGGSWWCPQLSDTTLMHLPIKIQAKKTAITNVAPGVIRHVHLQAYMYMHVCIAVLLVCDNRAASADPLIGNDSSSLAESL